MIAMRLIYVLVFLPFLLRGQILPNLGGQRAGISALAFLKNEVSPRMAAMGGAHISTYGDGYAWNYNPAVAANMTRTNITITNTLLFGGLNQFYASLIVPTQREGAWGFTTNALSSGPMKKRTEFNPDGTGEYFYATYASIGFAYSKKLSDKFNFGMKMKYVNETIDMFTAHTVLIDMGFFYKMDFKDIQFAVVLYNFGPNSALTTKSDINVNISSYPPPTVFSMGISFVPKRTERSEWLVAAQLNHPNDEAENLRFGVEYSYMKLLFFRVGYQINVDDRNYPTAGFGVRSRIGKHPLMIDYAFVPHNYMGIQHKIGLSLYINKDKRTKNNEKEN